MLWLLAIPAYASGLDVPQVGSTSSGPLTADPAAVYWNPAQLARIERPTLMGGLGLVGGRVGYTRQRLGQYQQADSLEILDPIDPAYLDPSRSGSAEPVAAYPFSPNADGFGAIPLGKVALGFGLYVPYAAPLGFPEDGAQRYALQEVFIAVSHVSGGAAVQLGDWSVGAGVTAVLGTASLSRVQDFAGLDLFSDALSAPPISQENSFGADAPSTVRELDVLSRPFTFTNGQSLGVDANVGISFVHAGWALALSGQLGSKLKFRGDFALDMDDPLFTRDLSAQGLVYAPLVTGEGELSFRLPPRAILGVGREVGEDLTVELMASWVGWRVLDDFELVLTSPGLAQPTLGVPETLASTVPRSWQDAVHVEGTVRSRPDVGLGWLVTAGAHTSASPDATVDVASPDGLRLIGGGGLTIATERGSCWIIDVEGQGILPRTVVTSDYDLANGRYDLVLGAIGGHLLIPLGGGEG